MWWNRQKRKKKKKKEGWKERRNRSTRNSLVKEEKKRAVCCSFFPLRSLQLCILVNGFPECRKETVVPSTRSRLLGCVVRKSERDRKHTTHSLSVDIGQLLLLDSDHHPNKPTDVHSRDHLLSLFSVDQEHFVFFAFLLSIYFYFSLFFWRFCFLLLGLRE